MQIMKRAAWAPDNGASIGKTLIAFGLHKAVGINGRQKDYSITGVLQAMYILQ